MIKSWSELSHKCPIDISRVERYAKEFETSIPNKIEVSNLNESKDAVLRAKGSLESMITSLIQVLYDREILEKAEDKILFAWLVDNLGRYLKRIDDAEFDLLIKDDTVAGNEVGISKVATYSNFLRASSDSLVYESLLKATSEWESIEDSTKKTKRAFLYILFLTLQVTASILGGLSREKTMTKRGIVQTIPTTWQSLMGKRGQQLIRGGYEQETGVDLSDYEEDLNSLDEDKIEGDLDDED